MQHAKMNTPALEAKLGCADSNRIIRFCMSNFRCTQFLYVFVCSILSRDWCGSHGCVARYVASPIARAERTSCAKCSMHFVDSRLGCISGRAHQQSPCSCDHRPQQRRRQHIIAIQLRQCETDWRKSVSKKTKIVRCNVFAFRARARQF